MGDDPAARHKATWVSPHLNGHPLDANFGVDEAEQFVLDGLTVTSVPPTAAPAPSAR